MTICPSNSSSYCSSSSFFSCSSIVIKLTFYISFSFICRLEFISHAWKQLRAHRSFDQSSAFCNTKWLRRWPTIHHILVLTTLIHAYIELRSHQSVSDEDVDLITSFVLGRTFFTYNDALTSFLAFLSFSSFCSVFFFFFFVIFFFKHERNE